MIKKCLYVLIEEISFTHLAIYFQEHQLFACKFQEFLLLKFGAKYGLGILYLPTFFLLLNTSCSSYYCLSLNIQRNKFYRFRILFLFADNFYVIRFPSCNSFIRCILKSSCLFINLYLAGLRFNNFCSLVNRAIKRKHSMRFCLRLVHPAL